MTIEEKLSRLSASSRWRIEILDRSFNSLPLEILAGALPGDKLQQNILLAKYAGDDKARQEAKRWLYLRTEDMARIEGWDVPRYIIHNDGVHDGTEIYLAICFQ